MPLLVRSRISASRAEANQIAAFEEWSERPAIGKTRPAWAGARPGIFPACANPHCGSGRLRLWRRRTAPVFEGGWCCSAGCTAARVEAALRRELNAWGGCREGLRHRIPLGLAMLEQGWITQTQLRLALAAQREAGAGRLGQWLVRQQSASEDQVTRAVGLQWSCPVLGLELHRPEGLAALVPRLFVDAFGALPLRVAADRILYLGFEDRPDPILALAVERMTGLHVECGIVEESDLRPAQARMLEAKFPAVELVEAASESALAATFTRALERAAPVEARLVRVHDCLWLRMGLAPQNRPVPESGAARDLIGSIAAH